MADEKMVYASMEAMAKAFSEAQKTLQNTKSAMDKSSKTLSGGGLLGKGGDTFIQAFGTLQTKLDKFISTMNKLEKDINKAVQKNKEVVEASKKGF